MRAGILLTSRKSASAMHDDDWEVEHTAEPHVPSSGAYPPPRASAASTSSSHRTTSSEVRLSGRRDAYTPTASDRDARRKQIVRVLLLTLFVAVSSNGQVCSLSLSELFLSVLFAQLFYFMLFQKKVCHNDSSFDGQMA